MPTLADVAIGPMILLGGLLAGLALFIPIVLLEALVLWAMRWAGFKRALRDSAIVNGVSTILLDLTQRMTRNRSASFAEVLLTRVSDHQPLLRRSHHAPHQGADPSLP